MISKGAAAGSRGGRGKGDADLGVAPVSREQGPNILGRVSDCYGDEEDSEDEDDEERTEHSDDSLSKDLGK